MDETFVYQSVCRYLSRLGWTLLGGQPPSGTDHLPVIEVKDPGNMGKGSKGSYKPDLVAWHDQTLLLVELKPRFSPSDRSKLLKILNDEGRKRALWREIAQRRLVDTEGTPVASYLSSAHTRGALGFGGPAGSLHGLWALRVDPQGRVVLDRQGDALM